MAFYFCGRVLSLRIVVGIRSRTIRFVRAIAYEALWWSEDLSLYALR